MEKEKFQLPYMIKKLHTSLLVMYTASSQALVNAVTALAGADRNLAFSTIEGDKEINMQESEIDDLALSILVRTQALACDLRLVIGALGIINDLERIGDESVVIAERAALATPEECGIIFAINEPLAVSARQRVQEATAIFKEGDVKAAIELCARADDIAQTEVKIVQAIIDRLASPDDDISPVVSVQAMMVCRALARICNRAINLAEHTYFIYTGENIKHADLKELHEIYSR